MGDNNPNPAKGTESASSLEHALLESLFYNEMMMMEDPSSFGVGLSTDFMTYLSSSSEIPQLAGAGADTEISVPDAGALAEKAMLRDFGVASTSHGDLRLNRTSSAPWSDETSGADASNNLHSQVQLNNSVSQESVVNYGSDSSTVPPTIEQEKKGQTSLLISQFATLAGRLGISLPSGVLQSLSRQANDGRGKNAKESLQALSQLIEAQAQKASESDVQGYASSGSNPDASPVGLPDSVGEIAVSNSTDSRKRAAESSKDSKAPLYSKRRKKPRLSDCETRLARLKAENEMLKRHLDTISHRSQKFDEERKAQEEQMKRLMNEGAGPEKLNPLVSKFSEVYSDYGRHRDQELTFHLEQLEKMVAPTNFTKMGLWTLGQNERFYTDLKNNPIAGILREELGITPQQGRKILEQSQKIRDLSENLKECLRLLGKLKSICEYKQKVFSNRMSKCQEILTPLQVVKLLLWVDEHSHILESTCPGWGSERIHGHGKKEVSS